MRFLQLANQIAFTALGQIVLGYFTLFIQAIYPVWSSPFWPASGAALAAVFLGGPRMLVGVYLGLLVLGLKFFWGPYPFWMPFIAPCGNLLETFLAFSLLRHFAPKFDLRFGNIRQLSLFILLCPWIPALASAMYSQLLLQYLGTIPPERFLSELVVFALGNATGILLVTPILLVWRDFRSFSWKSSEGKRVLAHLCAILLGISFYYTDWAPHWGRLVSIAMIPLLVWGVWGTGIRGATLACLFGSISYFAFDVPGSRPLSTLLKQKQRSAELQFVMGNKLHPNEGLQTPIRLAREISDQVGLLAIICITILPLGVAADDLRRKAERDQMAMAAFSSSFWNWNSATGLEIENPEIGSLFPPDIKLFKPDRPSGSLKVHSELTRAPTYLSHWVVQQTDSSGSPLKVTGILQNFAVEEERDAARLEARLLDLEIQSLRAHLNPHLIFNCLTGLRGLISEDPAKAREFSGNLARFLRAAVDSQNQKAIPLQREISICEDFARLEELRGRPTSLQVRLGPQDGETQIPPLTLVTLLENAGKHGNRNGHKILPVEITSDRPDSLHLRIQVRQPGVLERKENDHNHAGLNLIRRQINMVLGSQARLDLIEEKAGTVVAQLILPI